MTLRCEVSETPIRRTRQNCGVQVWESVKPPRVGLGRGDVGDELCDHMESFEIIKLLSRKGLINFKK